MRLTKKNILIFLAPVLIVFVWLLALDFKPTMLIISTLYAYALMLAGWVLVDIFGD